MKFKVQPLQLLEKFSLIIWALFFTAYWSGGHFFRDGNVFAKSLGTWADGAAHLTYISAMAFRNTFPTQLPTYIGKPFIYPFVADGLSAILVRLGLNIFISYSLVGLILSLILVVALLHFFKRFTNNHLASILGLHIFLLSGGLGFIHYIQDLILEGPQLLTRIPKEYTRLDDLNILWLNVITGELIPQRALLLALPLGLFILLTFWQLLNTKTISKIRLLLTGLTIGLLPIIHPHTLIALTPAIIWFSLIILLNAFRSKKFKTTFLQISQIVIPALVAGLPLMFLHILPATGESFIKWYPGWLAKANNINWFYFWYLNWGIFPLLAIAGIFQLKPKQRQFLYPFIFIFILSNLILFQPYDWDNSKVITWAYLIFSPIAGLTLATAFTSSTYKKILAIFAFIALTASGFIDVVHQLQPHVNIHMYTPEELQLVDTIKTTTDPHSILPAAKSSWVTAAGSGPTASTTPNANKTLLKSTSAQTPPHNLSTNTKSTTSSSALTSNNTSTPTKPTLTKTTPSSTKPPTTPSTQ